MLGIPAVMVHPSPPTAPHEAPSCWTLPQVRSLLDMPEVRQWNIHQCKFGATALHPTSLLVVHMPTMREFLCIRQGQGIYNHGGRHRWMRGNEEERRWITSRAKVFPPKLCEFLGACLLQQVRSTFPDSVASHCPCPPHAYAL
eukprot:3589176-Pyramimonas_sp.AAC.1